MTLTLTLDPDLDPDPDPNPDRRLSLHLHLTRTLTEPQPLPWSLHPEAKTLSSKPKLLSPFSCLRSEITSGLYALGLSFCSQRAGGGGDKEQIASEFFYISRIFFVVRVRSGCFGTTLLFWYNVIVLAQRCCFGTTLFLFFFGGGCGEGGGVCAYLLTPMPFSVI